LKPPIKSRAAPSKGHASPCCSNDDDFVEGTLKSLRKSRAAPSKGRASPCCSDDDDFVEGTLKYC
jgi:hypothetical protein